MCNDASPDTGQNLTQINEDTVNVSDSEDGKIDTKSSFVDDPDDWKCFVRAID